MAQRSASAPQGAGGAGGGDGFGRERRRRRRRRGRDDGTPTEWTPVTKLGRLVQSNRIKYLEEIYLHSLAVKEPQIIDYFLKESLKDEVMKIMPVQKQTRAGQRTRFKAFVVLGDSDGHIGLGVKCSKEVATAIRGAINVAKLCVVPIRRGYWGARLGKPHTIPGKVNGKCGSVKVRLVPAPRGTGIVAATTPKKIISMAGIQDVYSACTGCTATQGNFAKATFHAVSRTYQYLTPDLWGSYRFSKSPFQEHTDFLANYVTQEKKKKAPPVASSGGGDRDRDRDD